MGADLVRRRHARIAVLTAVLTAAVGLVFTGPASAAQFCNMAPIVFTPPGQPTQAVQSLQPYPSQITVSGQTGVITDVNVTLNDISYELVDDLDILLVAPDGTTRALIMSDVGGGGGGTAPVSGVNLVLDDQAQNPLPADAQLTSGTFRPLDDDDDLGEFDAADTILPPAPGTTANSSLSTFNGLPANGTWSLYVVDDFPGPPVVQDIGGGWCIDVITAPDGTGVTTTSSTVAPTTTSSTVAPTTTSSTVAPTTTSSTVAPTTTSSTVAPTTTSSTVAPTTTSSTVAPTTTSSTVAPTTTSSTVAPTTTTSQATTTTVAPTTTTSQATTTTVAPTTTVAGPTTTTTTVDGACASVRAAQAAFNTRITAIGNALPAALTGAQRAAVLANLAALRAQGNAQFTAQLSAGGCVTAPPTTTTTAPAPTTTVAPTTTTTVPAGPTCAQIAANRAAFNTQIDRLVAAFGNTPQIQFQRAAGNAQFDQQAAAAGCTPGTTTTS